MSARDEASAAPAHLKASVVAVEAMPASSSMVGHCSGRSAWTAELVKVRLSVQHCKVAKPAKPAPHAGSALADRANAFGLVVYDLGIDQDFSKLDSK